MKNLKLLFVLFYFLFAFAKAQDSTKLFYHEIGFNTVGLVKQLISNNPSATLSQLPYDVFYNLYYKDKIGYRMGFGIATTKTETSIEGEALPRTTNDVNLNLRFGLSYNFIKSRRLTVNAFGDFVYGNNKQQTMTTTTVVPVFGNPVDEMTTTTSDIVKSAGFQVGVGVKYNIYRHLSLYIEVPFSYVSQHSTSSVQIQQSGDSKTSLTTDKIFLSKISLPTTVYLVLRF